MPAQALYLKWRPMTLDDVVGQEHITTTLRNALKQGKVRHAYLFSGPRGTGKTSIARLLAKAVNCQNDDPARRPDNTCAHCVAVNQGRFLDLIEIDAASHTGVDDVRDLRDKIAFSPNQGAYKVYIIDEVHRFSGAAFDALLKTLEEPPPHALFVLATTEIDKVPATIRSRCQRFDFRRIPTAQIVARLAQLCESEGLKVQRRALELVARQSTGSLRDAISLIDQLVADPDAEITLEMAEDVLGASGDQAASAIVEAVLSRDMAAGLEAVHQAVDAGAEPRQLARAVVDWLRNVLLVAIGGPAMVDVSDSAAQTLTRQAQAADRTLLLDAIRAFNDAIQETQGGWQPQLPLELALATCTLRRPPTPATPPPSATAPTTQPTPAPSPTVPEPPLTPATPPPKPEPAQMPAAPAPETVTLAQVQEQWAQFLQTVGNYNRTLPPMLEHVRPLRVEGAQLVLGTSKVFKGLLDDEKRSTALVKALADLFGAPMTVRVVVSDSEIADAGGQSSNPASGNDPLLAAAIELGGKVVSVEERLISEENLDAPGERAE